MRHPDTLAVYPDEPMNREKKHDPPENALRRSLAPWESSVPRRRRPQAFFRLALALALLAASCSTRDRDDPRDRSDGGSPVEGVERVEDRSSAPLGPASRIVSLSPLATRFLTQLGAADRILPFETASADADRTTAAASGSGASPSAADLDRLIALDPDVVFLPALPDDRAELARLEATGARIVEFAPHDLEDILAYCREVGTELVGAAAVEAFQRRVLHPVARIAGQAPPDGRLRAIALVDVDPPIIAGGHSYETDLIELAGATSLTHGGDDDRRPIDRATLEQLAPDFVLVTTEGELGPADQDRALLFVGDLAPVVFFPFARETFWLDEPVREVERMREEVLALEAQRAARD